MARVPKQHDAKCDGCGADIHPGTVSLVNKAGVNGEWCAVCFQGKKPGAETAVEKPIGGRKAIS